MPASAIRSWMAASSSGVTMTCRWTFRLRFSISVPAPGLSGVLWAPLPYPAVLCPTPGAWAGWACCWVRRRSCCSSALWRARRFSDSCLFSCMAILLYRSSWFLWFRFWPGSFGGSCPLVSSLSRAVMDGRTRSGLPGAGFSS